ncbi:2-oxoacid:ferredoxin oxidoreductase subunit beta [Sedimenticola thiotaurini]|uniref:2-oxoglutarate synthase n=1 Tax=Sedimenticola thiotaurini TaxID=1543721 RepID=A0A0F7JVX9_9GAMM|nr:2-oxoacid:ferredoxin oxidoreductase subunit beta [Sedimenticola thiotaurini]AKH20651.1 2-oxoglutarate synthase [Sedimenticola thiotaurini]
MPDPAPQPPRKAKDYKSDVKPIWCPGCGHFAVLSAITKALAQLALPPEQIALVSGIGCSSRLPAYTHVYGFHGVHGRALPVATGLKTARPDLTVLVTGGDGDGFSIGGNHFIHACRRNPDLTYIVMDNQVYGMTKGQASPTTAPDWTQSKLTPHGTGLPRFNPAAIALAAGAGFIARGFSGDPTGLAQLLVEAIQYPGLAFVHVLSPCVTFQPEQKAWKQRVHQQTESTTDDPLVAAQRMLQGDPMTTGLIFRTPASVISRPDVADQAATLTQMREQFLSG